MICFGGSRQHNTSPMMFWIVIALMAASAVALLALPVMRHRPGPPRAAFDQVVFRDQLAELERDLRQGLIESGEAEAARNEVARRLVRSAAAGPGGGPAAGAASGRIVLAAALMVPVVAVPVYLAAGRPDLPDVPRAERLANAAANQDLPALIVEVEAHLATSPDDLQGWQVLAPAYKRSGRWQDAARAYGNIVRLAPDPSADLLADHGEMLVFAAQGSVSAEAAGIFARVLKADAKNPRGRFFSALALKQNGRIEEAERAFRAFLADSPPDAGWRPMVEAELRDLAAKPPAPTEEQLAAGAAMPGDDRQAMIRSMVDGLEARLAEDSSDLDGWLRLIRARSVLNGADRAREALEKARSAFRDRADAQAALDGLARDLGL